MKSNATRGHKKTLYALLMEITSFLFSLFCCICIIAFSDITVGKQLTRAVIYKLTANFIPSNDNDSWIYIAFISF